jgi:hypothetical protein
MEKKNIQAFFCKIHPTQLISGFCNEEKTFLCSHCQQAHRLHDVLFLYKLRDALIAQKSGIKKGLFESLQAYNANKETSKHIIEEVQTKFKSELDHFQKLLEDIKDAFMSAEKAVKKEIESRISKIEDFPDECKRHLELVDRICNSKLVFDCGIDPDTLKKFCIDYSKERFKMQNVIESLNNDINSIKESFNLFSHKIEKIPEIVNPAFEPVFIYAAAKDEERVDNTLNEVKDKSVYKGKDNSSTDDATNIILMCYEGLHLKTTPEKQEIINRLPQGDAFTWEQIRQALVNLLQSQMQSQAVS